MTTRIDEIADGIFRISTYVPEVAAPDGFTFNQFLIRDEQPLLFHTGQRGLFPSVFDAVAKVIDPTKLRWITFGHYEADECGSMNIWLGQARDAEVAHGAIGCDVSIADAAERPPRVLADREVIDLGNKQVRYIDTPHTPHGWDAGLLFEETTGTLFCGDLFTQTGGGTVMTEGDIVGPAETAEQMFQYSSLHPAMGETIRGLADLSPKTLALMHGPSFAGNGAEALRDLGSVYHRLTRDRLDQLAVEV